MPLFQELPISWPWYQKKEFQNRYRQNVAGRPDLPAEYKPLDLVCPNDALLPFQFYLPSPVNSSIVPTAWNIYRVVDDVAVQNISLALLDSTYLPGVDRKYFYHDGRQQAIHLGTGTYYCRIDFPNGFQEFSEVFHVCDFSVNQLDCPYLKLQWWNDSDLDPIYFNDILNGRPRFTNVVYLDTFLHEYEPELVQQTRPGGFGITIPESTLANLQYKLSITVPLYLKVALAILPLYDHVLLTTAGVEHRTGEIDRLTVNTEPVLNSAFSNVEITIQENFIQKTECSANMV